MKYYFIKYNRTIYILYSIIIMLIFSTFSSPTLCAEEELTDTITQKENNNLNTYIYYGTIAILSTAVAFTIYSMAAYYYPSLDYFNLFNDIDTNTKLEPFIDRYSFKTLANNSIDYIEINPALYKTVVESNLYLVEQNKLLVEANLRYQEQLEYLWYKLDVPNLDYLKGRPEPLTGIPSMWTPIDRILTTVQEMEVEEDF